VSEIIFWGATGQAKVLHEALTDSAYRLVAIVDNRVISSPLPGVLMLHGEPGLRRFLAQRSPGSELHCAAAIGGDRGADRLALFDLMVSLGLLPLTVVHPRAFVARDAVYGLGCQLLAQSAVCAGAELGRCVIVNTAASVDHDCLLGDGVHIGPGAHLAGEVVVGARVFIGTGAVVLPRLHIGEEATVGAGAVVTQDVPPGATVVGNPARAR
jgi:sugar O-acyltransferase (sialic acid O-acetyltransferase NeuD family)